MLLDECEEESGKFRLVVDWLSRTTGRFLHSNEGEEEFSVSTRVVAKW